MANVPVHRLNRCKRGRRESCGRRMDAFYDALQSIINGNLSLGSFKSSISLHTHRIGQQNFVKRTTHGTDQIIIIMFCWLKTDMDGFFSMEHFFMIQFADAERTYRSDCETDDAISVANDGEYLNGSSSQQLTSRLKNRSPLTMRQSSPFPNEMTNRRMQQYNNAQERLRNGERFGFGLK